jgi:hypothetical protein
VRSVAIAERVHALRDKFIVSENGEPHFPRATPMFLVPRSPG